MDKIFTFSICLLSGLLNAQVSQLILSSNTTQPLVIMVDKNPDAAPLLKKIAMLPKLEYDHQHYLLIYGEKQDTAATAKIINDLLNTDKAGRFDKQKVYLLMVKADPVLRNYLSNKAIFADMATYPMTEDKDSIELQTILKKFRSKNLWLIDVSNIEEKYKKITQKTNKLGFGLVFGYNSQHIFKEDTAYLPSKIIKYGISINYQLTNRIQLAGKVLGSFKIPNKSKIQSSILNQIDLTAGGEQTVNAVIEFHTFIERALQANYQFTIRKRIRGFTGIGISQISFNSARSEIEQTIDVSNLSPGSGGASNGLNLGNQTDLPKLSRKFMYTFLSCGLTYAVSPHMNFILNADYQLTNNSGGIVNGVRIDQKMNPVTFNAGVQFSFKNTNVYYQYLNANRKRKGP